MTVEETLEYYRKTKEEIITKLVKPLEDLGYNITLDTYETNTIVCRKRTRHIRINLKHKTINIIENNFGIAPELSFEELKAVNKIIKNYEGDEEE